MSNATLSTLRDPVRVGSLSELQQEGTIVVGGKDGPIVVFYHDDGQLHAVDNRCPHMGFPLHRGTVKDGVLTCHWHNANFDLKSGCTFDLFADDIPTYAVEVRDGAVWVSGSRGRSGETAYWKKRLQEGLEQSISLVIAKAVIALLKTGVPYREIVEIGTQHGVRYRGNGWGSGLTILTAMTNLLNRLPEDERLLPLYQGLGRVAQDTSGQSPRFDLQPLHPGDHSADTLKRWFRRFVEVRDQEGATRCLLTAVEQQRTPAVLVDMMMTAATDHVYLDGGHVVDFINKASEMLDHIGWDHASVVLPSLIRQLCNARRSEEQNAWRHPVDLKAILESALAELPALLATPSDGHVWHGPAELSAALSSDDPQAIINAMKDHLRRGLGLVTLSQTVTYTAALRIARFHTQNEFGDWIAVLHTFTYCNALHQAIKRTGSPDLARGVFHGAMAVYLDRFLNIPPARLPGERGPVDGPEDAQTLLDTYLETLNTQQQVEPAARLVYRYLALGHPVNGLYRTLTQSLLREDAEFHSFQMLEAGIRQYEELGDTEEGRRVLVAVARYLAAHAPTQRSQNQTAQIALRLSRGEALYEEG
ncbi:MAG: Rieske 2Fe-2S domain-containing protein [candidate division Zixibacteria bacterium]|nr:Rieske 2Fe-2S domain-containing protein [candidate division Zixibacteria bacterium]